MLTKADRSGKNETLRNGRKQLNFYDKARKTDGKIFAVAPMIDWTDSRDFPF